MQTHVIKLCCQGCGSDLEVDENVRFLTCNYCQSKLEVVRDVSVTHTRVLEKLERTTDRIAGNLKVIELQNDLARVDREWELKRQRMVTRSENGREWEPSMVGPVLGGIVIGISGLFLLLRAADSAANSISPIIGILVMGLAGFVFYAGVSKAAKFSEMRERYEKGREELLRLIEQNRER